MNKNITIEACACGTDEGDEPELIDSEYETWNINPRVLEKAFDVNPDVRLVVMVH